MAEKLEDYLALRTLPYPGGRSGGLSLRFTLPESRTGPSQYGSPGHRCAGHRPGSRVTLFPAGRGGGLYRAGAD